MRTVHVLKVLSVTVKIINKLATLKNTVKKKEIFKIDRGGLGTKPQMRIGLT